jgi:hypothetical protein
MTQKPIAIALGGGLDLVSPDTVMKPGAALAALNYLPVAGGYQRIKGYERFDGRPGTSSINDYYVVHFTNGNTRLDLMTLGTFVRTSGGGGNLIGYAIAAPTITSGTTAGGNAVGYFGLAVYSGTTAALGDLIKVVTSGSTTAAFVSSVVINEAVPEAAFGLWLAQARVAMRMNLLPVPGTGPVRGVWLFNNVIYALRNDGTGVAKLYTASSLGWTAVDLGYLMVIDHLQHKISPGDLITGATSAQTATIYHTSLDVLADSAALWTSNSTRQATLQIKTGAFSGAFTAGEDITVGGIVCGKVYGSFGPYPKVYSIGQDGNYQFLNYDFGSGTKIYWAGGADFAYEFDGTNPPIAIGVGLTFASRIAIYKNALFVSGGTANPNHVFVSVVGDPTNINDATLGAVELTFGSAVIDMVNLPNGLVIFCQNHIYLLSGNDSTDYVVETLSAESGALAYTVQRFGDPLYMDNSGLRTLRSGISGYGNSPAKTISRLIAPYLLKKRADGVKPTAAFICRSESQYWLFFDDGTGLVFYIEGDKPAAMPINIGISVFCACSVEVSGVERVFVGGNDGYVYELNKGINFSGGVVEHYIRFPFNHFGSPQLLKRLHKVLIDVSASGVTTLSVSADFDFGAVQGDPSQSVQVTTGGAAIANLGSNESWFDQQIESVAEVYLDGVARNVSIKISGSSADEEAHTLTGMTYLISGRGLQR